MRVLAHCSRDSNLLAIFKDSRGDVYKLVASKLLHKNVDSIGKTERQLAKQVALGIIYGMGNKELAKRFGISDAQAGKFIDCFFRQFPQVKKWSTSVKAKAYLDGFITTIAGRRRQIVLLRKGDWAEKARCDRQIVNSIIQGSASDILKVATIRIHDCIYKSYKERTTAHVPRLLVQVHDELIWESDTAFASTLIECIRDSMENLPVKMFQFQCPLAVTVSWGPKWGAMVPYSDRNN